MQRILKNIHWIWYKGSATAGNEASAQVSKGANPNRLKVPKDNSMLFSVLLCECSAFLKTFAGYGKRDQRQRASKLQRRFPKEANPSI